MEYSGYVPPGGHDEVVLRGAVAGRQFLAFWLRGGRVLAGMNVNIWDQTDAIQALVRSGQPVAAARTGRPGAAAGRAPARLTAPGGGTVTGSGPSKLR